MEVLNHGKDAWKLQQALVDILAALDADGLEEFPYDDCTCLAASTDDHYRHFTADLNRFWMDLEAISLRILRHQLIASEANRAHVYYDKSLSERFPEYASLLRKVSVSETPLLYSHIALHEDMRKIVIELLSTRR